MYATVADMLARFESGELVQLTDIGDEITGEIDEARVETALRGASTIIDGYVAAKYRTGQTPTPPLLTELACVLARHRLYRTAPPESVVKAQELALAQLKDISKGTIKLDAGEETIPERAGEYLVDRPERVFGRGSMGGF